MKKLLSLLLLLTICQAVNAQRVDKPGATYEYFCFVQRMSDAAYVVTDQPVASHFICDKEGKKVSFESDVEIINYMTRRGWVYVESIGIGDVYYVLKKIITTEKNIFQGILEIKNETKKEKRIMERPEDIQRKSAKEGLLNN